MSRTGRAITSTALGIALVSLLGPLASEATVDMTPQPVPVPPARIVVDEAAVATPVSGHGGPSSR